MVPHHYLCVARRFVFRGPEAGPVAVRAIADEMATAGSVLGFRIRNVRLTEEQALAAAAAIDALGDAGDDAQRYGFPATLFPPAS